MATVPEQRAGKLQQREVVAGMLVVAHQDGATLAPPGQRPFHDPAPGRVAASLLFVKLLLADPPDMRHVAVLGRRLPPGGGVVALVQAHCPGTGAGAARRSAPAVRPRWPRWSPPGASHRARSPRRRLPPAARP